MLNLINFIYVKTENEASKDHNEEKLKDLK